jgi:hypothetical protein
LHELNPVAVWLSIPELLDSLLLDETLDSCTVGTSAVYYQRAEPVLPSSTTTVSFDAVASSVSDSQLHDDQLSELLEAPGEITIQGGFFKSAVSSVREKHSTTSRKQRLWRAETAIRADSDVEMVSRV